jgi:ABC-type sugar transport system ATPase subunit
MYNGEEPTSHLNWTLVDFAEAQFLGLHTATWFLLAVSRLVWFLMNRTVHGRNAYAIGDNREAAVNAGIRVGPHMMINFMLIGFLAALSAVVFYSESGSVNPNDGELFELWAITAVVLGGTKLTGGARGPSSPPSAACIAIQLLRKGLGHIGADTETVNLVIGLILIAVLFLDRQFNIKGKEELRYDRSRPRPRCACRRHRQDLPWRAGARRRVVFDSAAGRGARPDGRERRRQVHTDEGARRHPPARQPARSLVGERPVVMSSPLEAKEKGIVFIHQELSLAAGADGGRERLHGRTSPQLVRPCRLGDAAVRTGPTQILARSCASASTPGTRVADLSIANQQMVEIARALTVDDAKAVIFDEPTASLTDAEKVVLFDVIADLQSHGVGIVYISHRMEEIFKHHRPHQRAARRPVSRHAETAKTTEEDITQLMIGRKLDLTRHASDHELGDVALEVKGLSCGSLYKDISFRVRAGEVVGFYGLVGAGRTEIAETLFGLRTPTGGSIVLEGKEVEISSPVDAINLGISLVPENRKEQGLVLGMNCRDNMTLPQVSDLTAGPFVSDGAEIAIFDHYYDKLEIKTPSWKQQAGNLSGGNQQKIVIGKWLSMHPKVLIVDEPTRGIDVGSKSEIHKLIRDLASQGYAVVVISSEMPEVLQVSDRIVAMYSGRIMREFTSEEVTEDSLIQAISGLGDNSGQAA